MSPGYSLNQRDYNFDIVFCLDATGSMLVASIIDEIRANAASFYQDLKAKISDKFDINLNEAEFNLRVKIIAFKDFAYDEQPIIESNFFVLNSESEEFQKFLNGIEIGGGGDESENALEALALAMKSDWVRMKQRRRHLIVMCTDAPALLLGERKNCEGYPMDMPKDFDELTEMWENSVMERRTRRMLVFAPDTYPWGNEIQDWSAVLKEDVATFDMKNCYELMAHLLCGTL